MPEMPFPHLLLLSASAGSGKTEHLARRYLKFALSSRIPDNDIANLLAVTFTNNAAREMKQRILELLKKLALGLDAELTLEISGFLGSTYPETAGMARKAVDRILLRYSDFNIRTIDSFMQSLLAASTLELGMRPNPRIVLSYADLLNQAVSLLFEEGRELLPDELVARYLTSLNESPGDRFPWDPIEDFTRLLEDLLGREGRSMRKLAFSNRQKEMEAAFSIIERAYLDLGELPLKGTLGEHLKGRDFSWLATHKLTFPVKKTALRGEMKALAAEAEIKWRELEKVALDLAEAFSSTKVAFYGELYEPFKACLERVKKRLSILHISDINTRLAAFLDEERVPEIYFKLGERLSHYLIDEFQDTDPSQWMSLTPLLYEALARDGSLFAVGDLKQAIYQFRRADYRIMRNLKREIEGKPPEGESWLPPSVRDASSVQSLETNFRSGGVLVQYVHRLFRERFPQWAATHDYEDRTELSGFIQEVLPGLEEEGYVRVRLFGESEKGDEMEDSPEEAGEAAVDLEVVEEEEAPEKAALLEILADLFARGCRPGDIAILTARNSEMEKVINWLTEAKIQATATGSLDIRKRRVIAEILELLKFLDSPVDNLAFARFICGKVFLSAAGKILPSLKRQDIWDFIASGHLSGSRGDHLYISFRENSLFAPLWDSLFLELYRTVGYLPLYDLVCLALKKFGVLQNFPAEAGAVLKLLEGIGALEELGKNNLGDFLKSVEEREAESFDVNLPEYLDAVRLLTFHKSKGLGFPVVINLIYGNRGRSPGSLYFRKEKKALAVQSLNKKLFERLLPERPDMALPFLEAHEEELCQQLNLLYVICTRAQRELYNLVVLPKSRGAEWLTLFEEGEFGTRGRFCPASGASKEKPLEAVPDAMQLAEDKFERPWTAKRQAESRLGDFYHDVLRNIKYLPEPSKLFMEELLERTRPGRSIDLSRAGKTLERFLLNPEAAEWFKEREGREILTEAEFVGRDGSLYRVDRVIQDKNQITLIDFKTGQEGSEEHERQIQNYLSLLGPVYPGRPLKAFLAYIEAAQVLEV
ncbi:MAG: UvrD-helicase domain-containing protein [bacterium]